MRRNINFIEQNNDILLRISFVHKLLKGKIKINFYNEITYLKYPELYRLYGNSSLISLNALCKTFNLNKNQLLDKIHQP